MNSLRRWLYRPKRSDTSLLAQFFFADEDLNMVAAELDSFDGRKDPERCTALVNQLRSCQDKVLTSIQNIMEDAVPGRRASRDFRCKFPDDVIQENLSGQLWFGAECLAAGSSIMNREAESASMRPLARALTKNLDSLRTILREQCLRNLHEYTDRIKEALIIFDKLFAEFELSYVSAMVPVKSMKEYDTIQEITVLFSETVQRALTTGLLTQEMIDEYDPALMFTIPRLAIVCGLVVFREGPLNPDNDPWNMSDMFRPFQTLLFKIRELLYTLSIEEMSTLERALCSAEEPSFLSNLQPSLEAVEGFSQTDFVHFTDKTLDLESSVSYQERLEGPIIVHSSNSGSPVTPVAQSEFPVGTMSTSTSCGTVIAEPREICDNTDDRPNNGDCTLNKSESTDSGLHSENASTSDSITTVSSSESHHGLNNEESLNSVRTLSEIAREATLTSLNDAALSEEDWGVSRSIRQMCADIVNDIVNMSVSEEPHDSSECRMDARFKPSSRNSSEHGESSAAHIPKDCTDQTQAPCDLPPHDLKSDNNAIATEALHSSPDPQVSVIGVNSASRTPTPKKHNASPNSSSKSKKKGKKSPNKSLKSPFNKCSKTRASCVVRREQMQTEALPVPNNCRLQYADSMCSSCSSCKSESDGDWDKESCGTSETSSYNSECHDDEEIALAIQAAELATRNEARSRFRSSSDMIHRLFVCISGVADQLQTNFASDLRNILRAVFDMNCAEPLVTAEINIEEDAADEESGASSSNESSPTRNRNHMEHRQEGDENSNESQALIQPTQEPPRWVPDDLSPLCMACRIPFTFVRRRHHCRNCGKIFCGRCSANSVPLPHFGHAKPVRVCNRCFMFQVTPFTVARTT